MKRLCLCLLVLSACHKGAGALPDVTHDVTLPASGTAVVAAENQFSLGVFQAVTAQDTALGNKIISPFSIFSALGMADNGAAGTTLDSINKALQLGSLTLDDLNAAASALITQLPAADNRVTLSLANSEWYDNSMAPLPSFSQTIQNVYKAKVAGLDFRDPASVTTINQWVAGQTQNMIPHILNAIQPDESTFLINAIFFKGTWTTSFNASATVNAPFTRGDGVVEQVPTMTTQDPSGFLQLVNDTVTMVELPYGGKHFVMDILEPAAGGNLRTLAAGLTPDVLAGWIGRMQTGNCILTMPRFKFGYQVANMKGALTQMGMGIAFQQGADFSNMYPVPAWINRVIHQASIQVDESGAQAAAATVVTIGTLSVTGKPPVINLDHAFLFTIRETTSGAILFTGMLNDPLGN